MLAVAGHPHVRSKISLSLSCFAGSPNPSAARHACVRARHVFKALSTAVAPRACVLSHCCAARGIRAIPAPSHSGRVAGRREHNRLCVRAFRG